jgi:hypothetical protein
MAWARKQRLGQCRRAHSGTHWNTVEHCGTLWNTEEAERGACRRHVCIGGKRGGEEESAWRNPTSETEDGGFPRLRDPRLRLQVRGGHLRARLQGAPPRYAFGITCLSRNEREARRGSRRRRAPRRFRPRLHSCGSKTPVCRIGSPINLE